MEVWVFWAAAAYIAPLFATASSASVIRSRRKNREEEEDILAAVKVVKMVSEQSSFTPVSCHAGGREVEGVVARLRVSCKLRCRFLV